MRKLFAALLTGTALTLAAPAMAADVLDQFPGMKDDGGAAARTGELDRRLDRHPGRL